MCAEPCRYVVLLFNYNDPKVDTGRWNLNDPDLPPFKFGKSPHYTPKLYPKSKTQP